MSSAKIVGENIVVVCDCKLEHTIAIEDKMLKLKSTFPKGKKEPEEINVEENEDTRTESERVFKQLHG